MLTQLGIGFIEMITQPGVIIGILMVILGTVLSIISTRLVRFIRKADNYDPNDKLVVVFKILGIILMLVGLVLMAVLSINVA